MTIFSLFGPIGLIVALVIAGRKHYGWFYTHPLENTWTDKGLVEDAPWSVKKIVAIGKGY